MSYEVEEMWMIHKKHRSPAHFDSISGSTPGLRGGVDVPALGVQTSTSRIVHGMYKVAVTTL
ncbi:hypothetical protein J6590_007001 [Homalodisca vitripennis]|nr:hypothetical protein J6590_007001 [Homalodisca vitripennis]